MFWEAVLWLNIVWCLYPVEAIRNKSHPVYLHTNNDGVVQMALPSIQINRNDAENKYLFNNNPELVDQEVTQDLRRNFDDNSLDSFGHMKYRSFNRGYPKKYKRNKLSGPAGQNTYYDQIQDKLSWLGNEITIGVRKFLREYNKKSRNKLSGLDRQGKPLRGKLGHLWDAGRAIVESASSMVHDYIRDTRRKISGPVGQHSHQHLIKEKRVVQMALPSIQINRNDAENKNLFNNNPKLMDQEVTQNLRRNFWASNIARGFSPAYAKKNKLCGRWQDIYHRPKNEKLSLICEKITDDVQSFIQEYSKQTRNKLSGLDGQDQKTQRLKTEKLFGLGSILFHGVGFLAEEYYRSTRTRSGPVGQYSHQPLKKERQLILLQKTLKRDEENKCVDGPTKFMDCNHCVCMGGQLYVCTARRCALENKERNQVKSLQKQTECVEGEQIRSFDGCNRCYCGAGHVLCTKKKCLPEGGHKVPTRECTPGEKLPSPDNCNTCKCNIDGEVVCTVMGCGPVLLKNIKNQGCIPDTWYSMTGSNSICKECYCINGKMFFCYVKLCVSGNKAPARKMLKLSYPGTLPDKCQKHDYIQDKCNKCFCRGNGRWFCKNRQMNKSCRDKNPETVKKPGKKINSKITTRYPRLPPTKAILDTETGRPDQNYNKSIEIQHDNLELSEDLSNAPDEDGELNPPKHQDSFGEPQSPGGPGEPNEAETPGGNGPESSDEFRNPESIVPIPEINIQEKSGDDHKDDIDTNVDRGPFCDTGEFFTLGNDKNCQGCFCTSTNEWKCWSIKDACRTTTKCNPGKMQKNSMAPCSVCYCGVDRKYYCATDESCSYSIEPSKCEAIACLDHCATQNANFGVCHQDKCVCVQ